MRGLRHIFAVAVLLSVCLGIPLFRSDYFQARWHGNQADVVSSATTVMEQPSGSYTVLVNRRRHTDEEILLKWQDFFEGKEIPVLFEDIQCSTLSGDVSGLEMAQSFQSRLPENQMTIKSEDGVLLLSKAEYGRFDVILLSDEFAASMKAENLYQDSEILVIHAEKKEEEDT